MPEITDPRASFGPVAENYVQSAVHNNPTALSRLVELVQPKGRSVLDIATGAGHAAHAFAPFVDRMVASDLTPSMAKIAHRDALAKGFNQFFPVIAKAETLPFRDGAYDGVICRIAAHHFDSVPAFLREVCRVLRPKGWFLLVDNVGPEDAEAGIALDHIERLRDPSHATYLSVSKWKQELVKAGFQIRQDEGSAKNIDMTDWLDRIGTPSEVRPTIHDLIVSSQGELRGYLKPHISDSCVNFELAEHLFLSDK